MNLIYRHDVIVNFLRRRLFVVKFRYWLKFHFNIITESEGMKAFVNKRLTRNPEIANIASDFLTISRDCVQLGIPNFGTIATNEMLLIAAKFQNYNFYCF